MKRLGLTEKDLEQVISRLERELKQVELILNIQ